MTTSCEDILGLYLERKKRQGVVAERMRQIRDAYNGDVVVPLPELHRSEIPAVANLTAMGLDQIATRVASTVPDVVFPRRRPTEKEQRASRDKRRATLGWWERSQMGLKLRRRARHLEGYGTSPVVVRPDFHRKVPRWQVRDPLATYASIPIDPDDPVVLDCIYAVRMPLSWLRHRYPEQTALLAKPRDCNADELFEVLEFEDGDELVTCAVGHVESAPFGITDWQSSVASTGSRIVELERIPNRAGLCTAVVPGRINLDRRQGRFDGMLGMHQMQARLFALEVIAVEKGVFPNDWLIARQNEVPKIIQVADGRTGQVGIVQGADLRQVQDQPGYQTFPTIDRLERGQRLTGGIPAEFGGESATNVRTGRRGENILSATIDFAIQEAQQILAHSMAEENVRAIAVDKGYFDVSKSFYVGWQRAKGMVDYKPSDLFDTDQNIVSYAQAGADANGIVISGGQRVGMGTLSKRAFMEMDPLVDDPETEADRVAAEALEQALLQGLQTQAAQGAIPPADLARIMHLVATDQKSLAEAVEQVQREAQERQAQEVAATDPAAQPGLAQPGVGAEAPVAIGEPEPSMGNLASLLTQLRTPQAFATASERPRAEARV